MMKTWWHKMIKWQMKEKWMTMTFMNWKNDIWK